jgi:hypothetical protein
MAVANTLAYYNTETITAIKNFYGTDFWGTDIIELLLAVINSMP